MKNTGLSLRMEQPCKESWSTMLANKNGRHCERCAKTVIDLSNLSDDEIVNIIANSSSQICVKLSKDQTDRELMVKSSRNNTFYKVCSSLFLFGMTANSSATHKPIQPPMVIHENWIERKNNHYFDTSHARADASENLIQGTVRDAVDKKGLEGVAVRIKDTDIRVITDKNGKYVFKTLPEIALSDLILEFNYLGYQTLRTAVHHQKKQKITSDVFLRMRTDTLSGEVCIVKRKKWWQFWR